MCSKLALGIREKLRLELNCEGCTESEGLHEQIYGRGEAQARFGL